MLKSEVSTIIIVIAYVIFSGVVIIGTAKAFGSNSIAMYIVVIGVAIGLFLLATHKGLNKKKKKMDE